MPEYQVDVINIEAVKNAYINGSLEIRPGYWTYWAGGRQKCSYVNGPAAIGPIPHEVFMRWVREENGYRVWIEDPVCSYFPTTIYQYITKIRIRTNLTINWLPIHLFRH
jgi:hypothetical protein